MIRVTIYINNRLIHYFGAVNKGLVPDEEVREDLDAKDPITFYDLQDINGDHMKRFQHNREDGAIKCAVEMLVEAYMVGQKDLGGAPTALRAAPPPGRTKKT